MRGPAGGDAAADVLRDDVRAVLAAWSAPDAGQAALRDEFVAFVDTHDDARRHHPG